MRFFRVSEGSHGLGVEEVKQFQIVKIKGWWRTTKFKIWSSPALFLLLTYDKQILLQFPKKGWIGSTRGRPSSTSPPPTVNSGSRWLFILFTLVFYPFVLRWFFIFFILVFYNFVPGWSKLATDSPQCDLDSEIEVNEQTNKNMETVLSTNISSNQFTRADRQTLNQHTMKSSGNS